MIAAPKPGTDLWRVLSLVAANDGLLVPARSTVPELSPWFLGVLAEMGDGATDEAALLACLRAGESRLLDEVEETEPRENIPEMLTLIALVRSGPRPTGDLLGKGNGETKRA